MSVQDPSGLTRERSEAMTLHEHYDLFVQRYTRMQELIRDAQLVVSDGPWRWSGLGVFPSGAEIVMRPLPGGTNDTTYYLDDGRTIQLPGATGDAADLEAMRKHFEAQGWAIEVDDVGREKNIWAYTDDGYRIEWMVQDTGQYAISVLSEAFWGPGEPLAHHISTRLPDDFDLGQSAPGIWAPVPAWDAPVIHKSGVDKELPPYTGEY